MKKAFKLLGVLVACFACLNVASAKTYDMTTDMDASEFDLTEDTVINGNNHTITGTFNIRTEGIKVVINDVTINADAPDDSEVIAIDVRAIGTSLELNNVKITNYTKAGVYAEQFASLVVDNSLFDGSRTTDIGEGAGSEADLVKRSAAGIDINIGNSASKDYAIEKIEITNSTFQNVLASEKNTTGGGIKVKIKNDAYLTSMGDVVIKNNTFANNVRDLVLGTNSPGGDTTQAETANFDIVLFGNTAMKVVNNSSSEADEANRTEVIDSKYLVELNYYEGTNVEKTEDGTGLVVDASGEGFDIVSSLEELEQNTEVDSLFIDYGNYSITINKEDIKDDLTNTITDLSLSVGQSTTTDGLLEYAKDGNVFIKTNVSGELPATKVVLGLNLIEYANKVVNLYYFNTDANELEFVNTVTFDENGNANVALEHYSEYVLSLNDLTDQNNDIENPSTNDNVITYVILGVVAVVGIAGTLIYLKKSKVN